MAQHSVGLNRSTDFKMKIKHLEEEKQKLENEVQILTSEKDYLQKSVKTTSTLQARLETLKDVESKYQELKQEVSFNLFSQFIARRTPTSVLYSPKIDPRRPFERRNQAASEGQWRFAR